jgi:hypothetical protein
MFGFRLARAGRTYLLMAAIGFTFVPPLLGLNPLAHAALSPEVGKHLQAAQESMKKGKFKEALAQIADADRAPGKNAGDSFVIEGLRASAATSLGDKATAIRSYEALLASGKVPADAQSNYIKAIAGNYYSLKDYPKAITWISRYLKEGGNDPQMRALLTQTQFLSGNCDQVMKEIQGELRASDKSGRALSEEQLQLLANCANKQKDTATYVTAIEKLVFSYPKKDYWADLLNRVANKPGFSPRLQLDVMRLNLSVGQLNSTANFMEMSQLSLQAGAPAEAVRIIEAGYKSNLLGTGAEAERHKRLRDLATKTLAEDAQRLPKAEAEAIKAKDFDALFSIGFALVQAGQNDKGFALMNQALAGTMKRPDEAKLHLGLAYALAGKKADAIKAFKSVQGNDGSADLARYWIGQTNRPFSG